MPFGNLQATTDSTNSQFNSRKSPPQIEELKPFEDDLVKLIKSIEFRRVHDSFQSTLRKDIKKIRSSVNMFIRADKTRNLYEMPPDHYSKLLHENVTKHYRSAPAGSYNDINREAKVLAKHLKLDDRMESLARSEAFLTLKDHKENFENHLPCRLINPATSEMGRVSKKLLEDVVEMLRKRTGVNLWRNTGAVIEWFSNIKSKQRHSFISFNIVDFYPSISAELLTNALDLARQYTEIPSNDIEVILHARKSLLFKDEPAWAKRDRNALFDVTMGSYDGAEVYELVVIFLLNNLAEFFQKKDMGVYRDDGLTVLKDAPGHDADAARKRIITIFQQYGHKITIQANLKTTNFLDASINLETGK